MFVFHDIRNNYIVFKSKIKLVFEQYDILHFHIYAKLLIAIKSLTPVNFFIFLMQILHVEINRIYKIWSQMTCPQ